MKAAKNHEGDDQRQITRKAGGVKPECSDHDLHADELQGDIGHGGDDARHARSQRQPSVAKAAADEIGGGDIAVPVTDRPQAWKDQIQNGINHDRVGHGEEADRTGAVHQGRNSYESVCGIKIAAQQEPSDEGAEPAAAEAPFMEKIEISSTPTASHEAKPGDEDKERDEDPDGGPIHPSVLRPVINEINDPDHPAADDDPQELIPVEHRETPERRPGAIEPKVPKERPRTVRSAALGQGAISSRIHLGFWAISAVGTGCSMRNP